MSDATKEAQNTCFFSNEKEILKNLQLSKKEVALQVHAGERVIHAKSRCHSVPSFCVHVQIQYHSTNSMNFKNFSSSLDLEACLNISMCM